MDRQDNVVRGVMGKADDVAAPIANKLDDLPAGGMGCHSFSADTPVATETGEHAISLVRVGERVLAYDEATGVTGYYTVTAVWAHDDPVVTYVAVDGEVIEATPEHPFYTSLHGWVEAGELWSGVLVRDAAGEYAPVQWVQSVAQTQSMWDLTVDVAHTFFVGDGQWLVHNACGRRGGPAHQTKVNTAEMRLSKGNWTLESGGSLPERLVNIPGTSRGRYADLVFQNIATGDRLAVQVGRVTKGGLPISRERAALDDLRRTGLFKHVFFLEYP